MILLKEIKDKTFWHEALQNFDDANIYQTWNFALLVQDEKIVKHFAIYSNQTLICLVKVRIRTIPIIKRGIAYIFNGPIWQKKNQVNDVQLLSDIVAALKEEFVVKQQLVLRIQPYIFSDLVTNLDFIGNLGFNRLEKIRKYQTLVLYLDKELDEIRKNFKQKWRNCLNQSERNELKI